ncbi:hypothetical protein TNCV_1404671 [Trichonephila clavipes]|nr:hypothetical protein TNCV_1404671 [Trichonephila clavipes]
MKIMIEYWVAKVESLRSTNVDESIWGGSLGLDRRNPGMVGDTRSLEPKYARLVREMEIALANTSETRRQAVERGAVCDHALTS